MKTNNLPVVLRISRPQGLTLSIRRSQHPLSPTKNKIKKEIYKTLIRNYIQNGLEINGQVLTLSQLQDYLNLSYKQLMIYIGMVTRELGNLMNPNSLQDSYRALIFSALKSCMSDRHQALAQYSTVRSSQVDGKGRQCYKPFVSSSVNEALRTVLQSTNQQMMLLTKLSTGPTTAIQNNYYGDEGNGKYLGTEEAVKIIGKRLGEGTEHISFEDIYSEHKLDDCPEVKAEIGQEQMITVNPKDALKRLEEHSEKRMKEEGIEDIEIKD